MGGWLLAAAAAYAAVFVLPYRFPLREPVWSDTWIAGANNQVAAVGLAVVSVAVTLVLSRAVSPVASGGDSRALQRGYLWGGIAAAVAWTAGLGWAVARAHMYWGDEGYFLDRLRVGLVFHREIYRDFEFAYGPALYAWPAMWVRGLAGLGVPATAAYLVSLALLQCAGLGLLFYTVDALPMRRSLKTCAFVLITFGTLTSLLGVNYSVFRFVLPLAGVVLLARQKTPLQAAIVAGLGEVAMLAVSPELGLAFGGAAIAMGVYRGGRWAMAGLSVAAGAGLFAIAVGQGYIFTLGNMAKGGFNLLLSPTPHVVVLLVAVVALGPLAIVRNRGALMVGLYVAGLGVLPAALGRCDPIHVFFDGMGFWLLSFVTLDAAPARWRGAWVVVVAAIFTLTQVKNFQLYQFRLERVLRATPRQEDAGFDEARFLAALGGERVSAPLLAPQRVLEDLTRTGQYVPSYFCGWVGVWDAAEERRKIAEMRRTDLALVALWDPIAPNPEADRRIAWLMRMGFAEHPARAPYVRGALLEAELAAHWRGLGRYQDFELYRRVE